MGITRYSWLVARYSWLVASGATRSPLLFPHRFGEYVFERRHAWPQMTNLDVIGRGQGEDFSSPAFAGDEHPHDVLVGRVTIETSGAQPFEKRFEIAVGSLHAQLVDASAWLLQRRNRSCRGHAALVHDDDVLAGVFDVGKQM